MESYNQTCYLTNQNSGHVDPGEPVSRHENELLWACRVWQIADGGRHLGCDIDRVDVWVIGSLTDRPGGRVQTPYAIECVETAGLDVDYVQQIEKHFGQSNGITGGGSLVSSVEKFEENRKLTKNHVSFGKLWRKIGAPNSLL